MKQVASLHYYGGDVTLGFTSNKDKMMFLHRIFTSTLSTEIGLPEDGDLENISVLYANA